MAVGLLALVTLAVDWRDLEFVAPQPVSSRRVLWFPALYLLFFALLPAILLTSLLFGAGHVLNVIGTGQLVEAVVQAVAAFLIGMVLLALLIRTGSIWVPIAALFLLRKVRNDTRLCTD